MFRKKALFLLALVVGSASVPAGAKIASLAGKAPYVPGEILVRFKDDSSAGDQIKAMAAVGAKMPLDQPTLFKVKLKKGLDVAAAVEQMKNNPSVQYAQPNFRYYSLGVTCALPTDNVSGYTAAQGWPFQKIQMDQAITLFNGWTSCPLVGSLSALPVTVAVLDTGISRNNPDLKNVPLIGFNAIGSVQEQDPSCIGCAYSGSSSPSYTDTGGCTYSMDDFGHGTYVSGIIGANWNTINNVSMGCPDSTSGFAGIAPNCILLAVKVLDCTGGGTTDSIVAGINFAVSNGAKVLNLSLGSPASAGLDQAQQDALDNAISHNCVIVAAAGNESSNGQLAPVDYPAAYSPVISVGATDENDNLAFYSNGGANLKMVAPGGYGAAALGSGFQPTEDVFSDFLCPLPTAAATEGGFATAGDTNFGTAAGTSAAAPFVSGTAALILSLYPNLTNAQVANAIINNTDSLNNNQGWNAETGYGRLNVYQALLNANNGGGQITDYVTTFNSPNPFYTKTNGSTNITLAITQAAPVELTIYDTGGQVVFHKSYDPSQLNNNPNNPQFKSYYVSWDGNNGAGQPAVTGIYFYTVKVNGQVGHNKIALIQGSK